MMNTNKKMVGLILATLVLSAAAFSQIPVTPPNGGGGTSPTGTGLVHVTAGAQDPASYTLVVGDIPSGLPYDDPGAAATVQTNLTAEAVLARNATNLTSGTIPAARVPLLNQATSSTAGNLAGTPLLNNGITATTQQAGDNTPKLATDAFVTAAVAQYAYPPQTATASFQPGITSVTCLTATCTSRRGTFNVVPATFTTGTFAGLTWTATPTAQVCTATQAGGTSSVALAHSVATTTGITFAVGVTPGTVPFAIDYSCQP